MAAYAWMYYIVEQDKVYWCYSRDLSASGFAEKVSDRIGKRISASDISYVDSQKQLERYLKNNTQIKLP